MPTGAKRSIKKLPSKIAAGSALNGRVTPLTSPPGQNTTMKPLKNYIMKVIFIRVFVLEKISKEQPQPLTAKMGKPYIRALAEIATQRC